VFLKLLYRVLGRLILVFAVLILVFVLMRLSAGDPAMIKAGLWSSPDVVQKYREEFGTNRTIFQQLSTFLTQLARGNLGESFRYSEACTTLIEQTLPYTLLLSGTALVLVIALSITIGIFSAVYPGSWIDRAGLLLAVVGQSVPVFWGGLMLVLIFSVRLGLLPSTGFYGPSSLILPVVVIVITELPWQMKIVRASMAEALSQDYIRTARAYGIREGRVRFAYAFRNAAIPYLTTLGVQAGFLLGGSVVAEVVFNYPGMGMLFLTAVQGRDYPLVQAITVVTASLFIFINLLVDIAYTMIDPRINA
jgi:ABC-type dipeptide/oligopeptide/nickel transport system permease component